MGVYKLQKLARFLFLTLISVLSLSCVPKTPSEFVNTTVIEKKQYKIDSLNFVVQIKSLINKKESAFYPDSYIKTNRILIDTILYNHNFTKSSFLVILEKPNSTLYEPEDPSGYHFDAKAFLATKDTINQYWNIKWFRIMNLNRYANYSEVSNKTRYWFFRKLITIKDHDGSSRYKYNMNDTRFWDGPAFENMSQMLELNISPIPSDN